MSVLNFSLNLPEALRAELVEACEMCNCHPTKFAAEALESVLAARRLPKVPGAKIGPRIGNVQEKRTAEPVSEKSAALAPVDIPTLKDLEDLEPVGLWYGTNVQDFGGSKQVYATIRKSTAYTTRGRVKNGVRRLRKTYKRTPPSHHCV